MIPRKSNLVKCKCDALQNLVPFIQFNKRETHPWRSVTFAKVTGLKVTSSMDVFHVF